MIVRHGFSHFSFLKKLFYRVFIPAKFWSTEFTDDGIKVQRLFYSELFIPWSEVECMDLSSLVDLSSDESVVRVKAKLPEWAKDLFRTRSFLVMIKNPKLIQEAQKMTLSKVVGYASNVLGFLNIEPSQSLDLKKILSQVAQQNQIKLTQIVLDF